MKSAYTVSRWTNILAGGVVMFAAVAAYHNSFSGPFILDDLISITGNPSIRHLSPIGAVLSPPNHVGSGGRPLLNLTFALNHACGGMSVRGYHVLNLLIHVLAGVTLFGVVRRTLLQPGLHERFGASATALALSVAGLWTVHPLQTESVTYVSQRAESLMGLFYLLALYCLIRGARPGAPAAWPALAVAACGAGMASKEVMVSAPLVLLLYDRTFLAGTFPEAWRQRWRLYVGLAATWLVLAYLAGSSRLQDRGVGYGFGFTWWTYALTECRVLVDYLKLAVWPHPLVLDYGAELVVRQGAQIWPQALVLGLLVAATLFALRHRPALGFVGCWFFVILAPTSSVVPVALQPMAENRMYLPLAAIIVLGVTGAHALNGRKKLAGLLALAAGLGCLTVRRNADYRSELAISADTVAKRPDSARAQNSLGYALLDLGRVAESIPHCETALRIQPDFADARANLGSALGQLGRPGEALKHLEEALRLQPNHARTHSNLASALNRLGRPTEAIPHCEAALRINPDLAVAHYNFGNALLQLGRANDAIPHYEAALQLRPNEGDALTGLGSALFQVGRVSEAIGHYEAALRLNPAAAEAHNNLAGALFLAHRPAEAVGHYQEALRLKPDLAEAHCNFGIVLSQTDRVAEAVGHFEEALRLKPDYARARDNLAQLRSAAPPPPTQRH